MKEKIESKDMETSPAFIIRMLSQADSELIRRMHAESWLATYPNEEAGVPASWVKEETDRWLTVEGLAKTRDHFESIIDNPEHFYRVAEDNGKIIGMIHGLHKGDHKHLGALYVDTAYHGEGVAASLMQQANEWFGDAEVDLEVITYNQRAIRFYQKYGFEIVPGENEKYKEMLPNVTMVRKGEKQ